MGQDYSEFVCSYFNEQMLMRFFYALKNRIEKSFRFFIYPGCEWVFPISGNSNGEIFLKHFINDNNYHLKTNAKNSHTLRRPHLLNLTLNPMNTSIHEFKFAFKEGRAVGHFRPLLLNRSMFFVYFLLAAFIMVGSLFIGIYITFFEQNDIAVWIRLVFFAVVYAGLIVVFYLIYEGVIIMHRIWWWMGSRFRDQLYTDLLTASCSIDDIRADDF